MKIILDAYAWIEYFRASDEGEKVKKLLENNESYTLSVNLAEVISKIKRIGGDVEGPYKVIIANSKILELNSSMAREGGLLHAEIYNKVKDMGIADCLLLQAARSINAKIVTGDRHFKEFREAILIR
ncbi:PIN domain nuclease [Candidatus Pacearchaeota archaeon]|nr:PIN domain nuclease [Candidatus Pacearchaeota archaeon]|tara:strand:- start:3421 stop:3801 length:381 start_codon:yes stop_codon:yes gene_type:complete